MSCWAYNEKVTGGADKPSEQARKHRTSRAPRHLNGASRTQAPRTSTRLANALIRSGSTSGARTFSNFKDELVTEARATGNDVVATAKSAATNWSDRLIAEMKERRLRTPGSGGDRRRHRVAHPEKTADHYNARPLRAYTACKDETG